MIARAAGAVVRRCDVAIIGGGFSGTAAALHLAAVAQGPLRIVVIDPSALVGCGVAYGVPQEHLLLNVPAGKLSIGPDRPGDFFDWCVSTGRAATPVAFLPRGWFAEYGRARLADAVQGARGRVEFEHVRDGALGVIRTPGGARIHTGASGSIEAAHVVLALGHGPARCPRALTPWRGDQRVLSSPWDTDRMAWVARSAQRVLLVGTGLTMYDAATSLREAGFQGEVAAVSRRGLVPSAHAPKDESVHAAWAAGLGGGNARVLVRAVRARCESGDWRGVIDSLRPHTARLWATLNEADRARFADRVAPYWDVHRHRAPPEVRRRIESMHSEGGLTVTAGALERVEEQGGTLRVRVRRRGRVDGPVIDAGAVVLCTGPDPDPRRWGSPLIDGLHASGDVSVDALGLGLRSSTQGFSIGRDGAARTWLSMLGPLRRGDLWESTAVPELSRQAADLAQTIAGLPVNLVPFQPVIKEIRA